MIHFQMTEQIKENLEANLRVTQKKRYLEGVHSEVEKMLAMLYRSSRR